jgi:methanogenic corrinoid protein MtbC1
VTGDLHDIGKNLVKMTAQRAGMEVEDLRRKVRFLVGGAPLTDQHAQEIGADGYTADAAAAAEKLKAIIGA